MTFAAWWELLKWAGIPAFGALCWWIRDLQSRHRHAVERLFERIEAETKARHAEADACRREHREAVQGVQREHSEAVQAVQREHSEAVQAVQREHREAVQAVQRDFDAWKLDAMSRFASAESLEKGISRLEQAIVSLGSRLERLIDGGRIGGGRGGR